MIEIDASIVLLANMSSPSLQLHGLMRVYYYAMITSQLLIAEECLRWLSRAERYICIVETDFDQQWVCLGCKWLICADPLLSSTAQHYHLVLLCVKAGTVCRYSHSHIPKETISFRPTSVSPHWHRYDLLAVSGLPTLW